jgi:hypothetical protein
MAQAQQKAMLSTIAAIADQDSSAELINLCKETQLQYLAAKDALEAHRRDHCC